MNEQQTLSDEKPLISPSLLSAGLGDCNDEKFAAFKIDLNRQTKIFLAFHQLELERQLSDEANHNKSSCSAVCQGLSCAPYFRNLLCYPLLKLHRLYQLLCSYVGLSKAHGKQQIKQKLHSCEKTPNVKLRDSPASGRVPLECRVGLNNFNAVRLVESFLFVKDHLPTAIYFHNKH